MSAQAVEAREAYARALRDYRDAQARVRALAGQLGEVAEALADPLHLAPQHPAAATRIPLHVLTGPVRREVDFSAWPDAAAVLEALATLHRSHARAHALYSWLLPEERAAVEVP
ncbi:MAG: hypothetical protein HY688_05280 [Chloroflexi bacterium]|nr:hypothetical protein [Chloroflexota bacterium]